MSQKTSHTDDPVEKASPSTNLKQADDNIEPVTSFRSPISNAEVHIDTKHPDLALKYAQSQPIEDATPEEYNRLKRKIDFMILPLICLIYGFQYLDKSTLSFSAVMGLRKPSAEGGIDGITVGQRYSWLTTGFNIAYLVFVFPLSRLIQRFPLVKTTGICIILWGVALACHAACHNYTGLLICRLVLGALESVVTPSFMYLSTRWYKQEESFLRTTIYYSWNGFGTIIGCGIAYGCLENVGNYSIAAWKVLYIVTGCLTILLGALLIIHLPDNPPDAWFFNKREKTLVLQRLKGNGGGYGSTVFKKYQFIECIKDPRVWLAFLYAFSSNIPNGGLGSFMSILLSDSLGFGDLKSLLMRMPGGAVETVGLILFALVVKYFPYRIFISCVVTAIVIMGSCLLAFCSNSKAQLAGLYLYSLSPIGTICFISLFAANTLGSTKKLSANAIMLIGYCVGNLVGPQTFRTNEAPGYHSAKIAIVVCYVFSLFCLGGVFFINYYENKRRDKIENNPDYVPPQIENLQYQDLTDRETPGFRYLY